MLNESAVYESKQICHQKTQPCFSCHLPCSLLQQAQRSCLDFRTPLGFTSLLSPPSHNPSTSSHQVYLSSSTIVPAVGNFDVSKNLFPCNWLHGFKILGAPPHQTMQENHPFWPTSLRHGHQTCFDQWKVSGSDVGRSFETPGMLPLSFSFATRPDGSFSCSLGPEMKIWNGAAAGWR